MNTELTNAHNPDASRRGILTSIQKCSVHDGPGIRTTVFTKGCNLRCVWCHNPETLAFEPEILSHPELCIGCGRCDEGCFTGAKVLCGTVMSPEEVAEQVLQDRPYYGEDGGVTVSGGEPTCQPEFVRSLLQLCEAEGIHTAIETNLACSREVLTALLPHCRMVMADWKLFDSVRHREYTGAGNEAIKENLRLLSESGVPFLLRTPVIAGINDKEDIPEIARFAGKLPGLIAYELLPYHPLGLSKGVAQPQQRFQAPTRDALGALAKEAARYCPQVRIAGRKMED